MGYVMRGVPPVTFSQKKDPDYEPRRVLPEDVSLPLVTVHDWLFLLSSRTRRNVLRRLHQAGHAMSAKELIGDLGQGGGSALNYHLRLLVKHRALIRTDSVPRRGSLEHFYASMASENRLVHQLLSKTRAEDVQAMRAARSPSRKSR